MSDAQALGLRQICSVLELTLGPAQEQALEDYLALLQRWNATYNLTSVREPGAMRVLHLADCLAVVRPLVRMQATAGMPCTLLDVGSGGGLPGVVVAVMLPTWRVLCVDAVGKKAAFVRQVSGALKLGNLAAEHARVEDRVGAHPPGFGVVAARAFSSLADLVALTRPALHPQGVWMAMKGQPPDDELRALPPDIEAFHVEPLAVPGLAAQRCLVWMRPRRDS